MLCIEQEIEADLYDHYCDDFLLSVQDILSFACTYLPWLEQLILATSAHVKLGHNSQMTKDS